MGVHAKSRERRAKLSTAEQHRVHCGIKLPDRCWLCCICFGEWLPWLNLRRINVLRIQPVSQTDMNKRKLQREMRMEPLTGNLSHTGCTIPHSARRNTSTGPVFMCVTIDELRLFCCKCVEISMLNKFLQCTGRL